MKMRDLITIVEGHSTLNEYVSFVKLGETRINYMVNDKPQKILDFLQATTYGELRGLSYESDGKVFWWDGDTIFHYPMEELLNRPHDTGKHLYLKPMNAYKSTTSNDIEYYISTYPSGYVSEHIYKLPNIQLLLSDKRIGLMIKTRTDPVITHLDTIDDAINGTLGVINRDDY